MIVPSSYNRMRAMLPVDEVSYGCGGIRLFSDGELQEAQVGYSVAPDGTSLCSGEDGAWQPRWVVIGYETACGDPLFIDTADPALPVLRAMHGEGAWEPEPVAISVEAFASSLKEFALISRGRSNPVEREDNPLPDAARREFLSRVAELNERRIEPDFWAAILEC
jgi:hypothetical protein